jgi:catechol 2,3-dioxygenase-like lactoylglutathione lyase family enzyme
MHNKQGGLMLKSAPVMISFSVDNLEAAKQFYSEKLGVEVDESMPGMLQLKLADGGNIMAYEKKDHTPATYTLLNFTVEDLNKEMSELKAKGVVFEKYDLPGTKTDENGVVDYGAMKIAFFNDPAGNNHGVLQMTS